MQEIQRENGDVETCLKERKTREKERRDDDDDDDERRQLTKRKYIG